MSIRQVTAPSPFLKWAGGKGQLLDQLRQYLPREFNAYHEPFVGSGAVFFDLVAQGRIHSASLSDINPELVNCYLMIRDQVEALILLLKEHSTTHSHDHYYAVRDLDRTPGRLSKVERAARMIYLNRTCYNGLWRVNSKGHFNVPMGRYNNPRILDEENLRVVSRALQKVSIEKESFEAVLGRAQAGDLVYFDPPYVPLTATSSFTSYTAENFGEAQQRQLAGVFATLAERGCTVVLSNSDTALVHDLYSGFKIEKVLARRLINSRADKRGEITEVVVLSEAHV